MKTTVQISILLALLSLAGEVRADCACGSADQNAPCTGTSVSENVGGTTFTWQFSCEGQACQCGRFATGDYWVAPIKASGAPVSAVTLRSVTPAGAENGLERNPSSNKQQGVLSCDSAYEAPLNLMLQLPYPVPPGSSLIKADKREDVCGTKSILGCCIDTYDVLTVLPSVPEKAGASVFRPGFAGATKTLYSTRSVDLGRLPSMPAIAAAKAQGNFDAIAARWRVPFYDHFMETRGDKGRAFTPAAVLPDYGATHAKTYLSDMLSVMGSESTAAKQAAVYALMQRGIDLYTSWKNGIRWPSGAGQSLGRKPPVAFLAALLENSQVRSDVEGMSTGASGGTQNDFQEDGQLRVIGGNSVVPVWGDNGKYCTEQWYWSQLFRQQAYNGGTGTKLGSGDNKRTCRDPYAYIDGPAGLPGSSYMGCCSSGPYIAYALGQWLMPQLRLAANDPEILDFADRIKGYNQPDGFPGGVWTVPDPCAPPDPRESLDCLVYKGGKNCLYYGKTWGADPARPGHCIKHRGDPLRNGRFPDLHGKRINPKNQPSLARDLWDSLRPCAGTCSCPGQKGLCQIADGGQDATPPSQDATPPSPPVLLE